MNKQSEIIERFKKVHGNKYDYSKVAYTRQIDKVCIICPIHGEFWQTPHAHLKGNECPKCGCIKKALNRKDTLESFIEKANKVHNGIYNYSKVNYVNSKTKVYIICPEHGEFWQKPNDHLNGQGCPKCAREITNNCKRFTKEQFIDKVKLIHGDKYDYSKVNYVNNKIKVCIICPKHGEFWQTPDTHLDGTRCPKCGHAIGGENRKSNTEEFIEKARKIHGDKYDYSKVEYKGCNEEVVITCHKHGDFYQIPKYHLDGCGCPKCGTTESSYETELYDFIKSLLTDNINIIKHDRKILSDNKELDIYIPDYNVAFEFDGLYWHSYPNMLDKKYHLKKTVECENKGIVLFHIFEDEWIYKKDIWKSIIMHALGKLENKINANSCELRSVEKYIANDFLLKNHIQGKCNTTINYGLFFNDELVSLMAFKKKKYDDNIYEITRFCNKLNIDVINSEKRLLDFFVKMHNPQKVIYKADRRWDNNKLLGESNFEFIKNTPPSFTYIFGDKRRKYNKTTLINKDKIYDCGNEIYEIKLQ